MDKADWILKKQKQYQEIIPEIIIPSFEESSTLPYLGKNYRLIIRKNQPTNMMNFIDGEFVIDIVTSDINEERKLQIRELYEDWLERMAQKILEKRVKIYRQKVGVDIQKISKK
jgi:predicted metal-dependent hydrolase